MIECPSCYGSGADQCYKCEGCGFSERGDSSHWTCSVCEGQGVLDCEACDGIGEVEDE